MSRERQKLILENLLTKGEVTVKELSAKLYASEPSIRRDLIALEEQGLIKRTHGGAILENNYTVNKKITFLFRELDSADEKSLIPKKAAMLVQDNFSVMMDNSSIACSIIPHLQKKKNIVIFTNSINALIKAGEHNIVCYSSGGRYVPYSSSLVGDAANHTIGSFNADICFFSCSGFMPEGFISDISIEENIVRKSMMYQSRINVLLVPSKAFGKKSLHNLCRLRNLDYIISDEPLPPELAEKAFIPENI